MKVGITGHQDTGTDETTSWVTASIRSTVGRLNPTEGFTCLAKGADQLFATVLEEQRIPFVAVIPCRRIEDSFEDEENRRSFRRLLAIAAGSVELPFAEPSEEAYFAGGKAVVDRSDVLIAVWDGKPAKGLGGTGDVVRYAMERGTPVVQLDLVNQTVRELSGK